MNPTDNSTEVKIDNPEVVEKDKSKDVKINNTLPIPENFMDKNSIIKVIGVGGGGNNAVNNMLNKGIEGVSFVICNTDKQVLDESSVITKIHLGKELTKGRGAGCDPEKGRQAAEEAIEEIRAMLEQNTEMVFITTGLGGGTGTGAAPIIAKEAKSKGILTVAIVTLPYRDEGRERYKTALQGLKELRQYVDSLLVINNQKIYEVYPELSLFDAFEKADEVVATAAKSIAELITVKGYINIDFADVKRFMTNSGMALMGLGRASGENRAIDAAKQALSSPLLNDNDIKGAKNILINITSSRVKKPLTSSELEKLMEYVLTVSRGKTSGEADCKRGVTIDESLDEDVAITIIATGFEMNEIEEIVPIIPEQIDEPEPVHEPEQIIVLDENDNCDFTRISNQNKPTEYQYRDGVKLLNSEQKIQNSSLSGAKLAKLEEEPAYLRLLDDDAKKKLNTENKSTEDEIYKYTLVEENGKHSLGENKYLNTTFD